MQDLTIPAFPIAEHKDTQSVSLGFTKLEYAALMIANGFAACPSMQEADETFANNSVSLAEAVLQRANNRATVFEKMKECLTNVFDSLLIDFEDDNEIKVKCKAVLEEANK